jgi:hypothetical protein
VGAAGMVWQIAGCACSKQLQGSMSLMNLLPTWYLSARQQQGCNPLSALLHLTHQPAHCHTRMQAADADALLASTAAADPSAAQYPLLMRVQLALDSSSPQQALQLLASPQYASLANAPAVLATRVALCESAGDQAAAEALLSAAVQHWQQQAKQVSGAQLSWHACYVLLRLLHACCNKVWAGRRAGTTDPVHAGYCYACCKGRMLC